MSDPHKGGDGNRREDTAAEEPLFSLQGRIALVTGGSRGMGREIVLAFARAGADVVIASRKIDNCRSVADEVTAATGRRALPVACHVGEWQQVDALVEEVYDELGRIDVLVNNAGIAPLYPSLAEHSEELYDKVFAVNLKGPFRLMANVGTRMADGSGGSIINVSSTGAIRPRPHMLPYSAAKAGLNAMTVGFARAFGPTVRVNCIQPGPVLTEISNSWDMDEVRTEVEARFALQRLGEPHEVVGAALYFASDASSWTTGAVLRVDGGMP